LLSLFVLVPVEWSPGEIVQGAEQAEQVKQRIAAVGEAEGHPVKVSCVASQVFAVMPEDGAGAIVSLL
jgi:hypothetical protein